MSFAHIQLIATDVDGTLLNSQHELSPDFYDVFNQLKAREVLFVLASGRQYHNLRKQFASIADDVVFIAENGSYVVSQDRELLVQALAPAVVRELILLARQIPDVRVVLCGKQAAYVDYTEPGFLAQLRQYYECVAVVPDLLQVTADEFLKIALLDEQDAERNSLPHFERYRGQLQVTVSGRYWLDLAHGLASKGRALAVLQQQHGLAPEQTMVFGDYLNDLDMMPRAHYSYAMANAHPQIKEAARYLAKSNDEHGVVAVLRQVLAAD
jgi:Cof subfamily protein (haloacid dehalogenase superfamily)